MSRYVFILTTLLATSFGAAVAPAQKLKVYILAGQSNMQGHAKVETFDYIGDDPKTAALLKKMVDRRGRPVVCKDVRISYLTGGRGGNGEGTGRLTAGFGARRDPEKDGGKIGPEFTFGLEMAEAVDGPILIIKTAWGGKSLHTDFRPPSAGPYVFREKRLAALRKRGEDVEKIMAEKKAATGRYYRDMIDHVKAVLANPRRVHPAYKKRKGYELAGFVWFQGWNDMVDSGTYPQRNRKGGYEEYTRCLAAFIRDVRKDLDAPKLPFVIGVMGVGGPMGTVNENEVHGHFRGAMAAPASMREFRKTVAAVPTAPYWDAALAEIDAKRGKVRQLERRLRNRHPRSENADGKMSAKEQRARVEKLRKELISEDEERQWKRGASNAGYHYLGSAKTMALIGQAFAEAMLEISGS